MTFSRLKDDSVSFGRPDQLVLDEFRSSGELFLGGLCTVKKGYRFSSPQPGCH